MPIVERQPNLKARRAALSESTRAALVDTARTLFVQKGYHQTGTEEIVAASGVGTRGALYHHFASKQELFEAVFIAVEQDLFAAAIASIDTTADPLTQLRRGLLGFLDASLNPEVQRILLIDGPAVLSWQRWRELAAHYGLGTIESWLEQAVAEGDLAPQPLDALAHTLLAATDESALFIANSHSPREARDSAVLAITALLDGLACRTIPTASEC